VRTSGEQVLILLRCLSYERVLQRDGRDWNHETGNRECDKGFRYIAKRTRSAALKAIGRQKAFIALIAVMMSVETRILNT